MDQNLMNAEFVFVESLTADNITLHVIRIIQASQRCPGKCRDAFAAHICAVNCIFYVIRKME